METTDTKWPVETTNPAAADAGGADEPLATRDEALAEGEAARKALLARLREAMLASEPALDRSMVTGDSLDELEASFAAARTTLHQLREAVRREHAATIPAGSAARAAVQPKSAFAKIRDGLAKE